MDTGGKMSSVFLKEIRALPLIQAAEDVYTDSKKRSRILGSGMALLEYGLGSLVQHFPARTVIASRVDSMAGEKLAELKDSYPSLQKSPDELKDMTYYKVRSSVRRVVKTAPGKMFLGGLDWMIDKGEGLLAVLKPTEPKHKNSSVKKSISTRYASEDSGACEGDVERRIHRSQQTAHQLPEEDDGLMLRVYKAGVIKPLDSLIRSLKRFRRYISGKRRKPKNKSMSPAKESEIRGRRKVSPKKKVQSSFLGKLRQRTFGLIGLGPSKSIKLGSGGDGAVSGDAEKKRKHSEILTDEGSATEEDIQNFDFENYCSEEDPDYEPTDSEASDDTMSEDLEPESDLEAETVSCSKVGESVLEYIQLKDKPPQVQEKGTTSAPRLDAAGKPEAGTTGPPKSNDKK